MSNIDIIRAWKSEEQTNQNQPLVPAVVFQQPDDLALVNGESTKRLEQWEDELARVVGGRGALGGVGGLKARSRTRSQVGLYIRNDD